MVDGSAPTYQQLLEEARELGRADGRLAAAFETPATDPVGSPRCLGRTPAQFAELLWHGLPGMPPSGLEQNAPLWYAGGFTEGLWAGVAERRRAASRLQLRRVFT
jgi:hypothetical protein